MTTKNHKLINEFTVIAVFVLAVIVGFAYAALNLRVIPGDEGAAGTPVAPSLEEYRASVGSIMSPFLVQAQSVEGADLSAVDPMLSDLASKTQERMLRVRVPGSAREVHLACVLLLGQWHRALDGSVVDREAFVAGTRRLVADNPWLIP